MRKRLSKLLIAFSAIFICVLIGIATVSAADNCDLYLQEIARIDTVIERLGCSLTNPEGILCQQYVSQRQTYINLYERNCASEPCDTNLNITRWNWQYKVDGINQYIFRITDWNGEVLFCIDPTMTIDTCTDYTSSTIRLSNETYQKIAIAIKRYCESPTTNHYIATQLYIWEVMGYDRTVSGNDWSYYWSSLGSTVEARYASVMGGKRLVNEFVNSERY